MKRSALILPLLFAIPLAGTTLAQQISELRPFTLGQPDNFTSASAAPAVNNFTMEAWVSPAESHQVDAESPAGYAGMQGEHYLIHPTHGTNAWGYGHAGAGMSVGTNGVSVYEHWAYNIPAVLVYSGPIKGWSHVAVVYKDRVPSIYINGTLVKTGKQSAMQFVHPSTDGIGGGYYGSYSGDVNNVRMWNDARNEKEIRANMSATLSTAPHLLVNFHTASPELEKSLRNSTSDTPVLNRMSNSAAQVEIHDCWRLWPQPIVAKSAPIAITKVASHPVIAYPPQTQGIASDNATGCRSAVIDIVATEESPAIAAKPAIPTAGGAVLETCRPNPITERSTIGYSLPADGHVSMKIFDAEGRELKTLVDDDITAGTHEATLNGSIFPSSGTYFCRMTWNGGILSQKMTVVK